MASAVKAKGGKHRRKPFDTITLPSHVQNALNKEERLLKQTLQDLELETKHTIRCISQDQQVAGTKLRTLQRKMALTQARSKSPTSRREVTRRYRKRTDTCMTDYFKGLLTPVVNNFNMDTESDTPKPGANHQREQQGQGKKKLYNKT